MIYSESSWILCIFDAQQAKIGGVVRRSVKSVNRFSSEQELLAAIQRRGFHAVKSQKEYIIFCNSGKITMLA